MTTNKDFDNFLKFLEEKKKIETEDGASVADKLNPFLAPGSRDTKTGEYKPKDPDVEYGKKDLAADLASIGPPVTSIPGAAYGTYRSLQRGEYGQAALNALGVIPGVGLLTKGTKLASTGQKISKFAGHADVGGSLGSVAKDVYDATKDDEPKPIQPSTPSEPKKVKPINISNEPSQQSKIEPVKVKPIKIQPESGGKIKMTDKKKSISEALAEVQRNSEMKKIEEAKKVWGDALDENILMERGGTSRSEKFFRPMKDWFKGKNADVNPPSSRAGDNAKDITGKATEIKPDTSKGRTKIEPVETPAPKTGSGLAGKVSTGLSGLALGGIAAAGLLGAGKKADEPAKPTELPKIDVPGEKKSSDDMTFGQAFAAARKAATEKGAKSTGQFEYKGKQYQTNIQGKGTPKAPEEKYVAPSKQTKVDIGTTKASAPTSTETPAPTPTPKQGSGDSYRDREPGWRDTPPQPAPSKPSQGFSGSSKDSTPIGPSPDKFTKPETESGGKRKKVSEEYIDEAGNVVGNVRTGGGNYPIYRRGSNPAQSFGGKGGAYAQAKPGSDFEWQGRKYHKPGEASKPSTNVPLPPKRPDDLGKTYPEKGGVMGSSGTTGGTVGGTMYAPNTSKSPETHFHKLPYDTSKPSTTQFHNLPGNIDAPKPSFNPLSSKSVSSTETISTESGGKKKKMSEETNPLIAAFLKLQSENPNNMFEAAKKAKKDYDKDGKVESPKDEVWGSRFAAAKKAGKMEEGSLPVMARPSANADVTSVSTDFSAPSTESGGKKKIKEANIDPVVTGSKTVTSSPKGYVDPSTPTQPYTKAPMSTAAGGVLDKAKNALDKTGVKEEVHTNTPAQTKIKPTPAPKSPAKQPSWKIDKKELSKMYEEGVEFSQEEIDHINSFFPESSIAPTRPEVAIGADSTSDKMSQNDVTATAESGGKKKIKESRYSRSDYEDDEVKARKEEPRNYEPRGDRDDKNDPAHKEWDATPAQKAKGARLLAAARRRSGLKEETDQINKLDEGGMPASVIASKKKYAEMSDEDFAKMHGHKSEKELRDMAARHGYGWDKASKTGSDHYLKRVAAANKTNEEVIQEGRPKKNPTPETTERDPRKHIQVEAGRAAAGNVVDFHHNDGTKSKITPAMGRRITSHLNSLKPADRQSAVNKMHDSAEGLKV